METVTIGGVEAEVAASFFRRAVGLIGRRALPPGKGLLILRCGAIHTCFMRFAIDATFLDRDGNVVKTVRGIPPWRLFVYGGRKAAMVLETAAR